MKFVIALVLCLLPFGAAAQKDSSREGTTPDGYSTEKGGKVDSGAARPVSSTTRRAVVRDQSFDPGDRLAGLFPALRTVRDRNPIAGKTVFVNERNLIRGNDPATSRLVRDLVLYLHGRLVDQSGSSTAQFVVAISGGVDVTVQAAQYRNIDMGGLSRRSGGLIPDRVQVRDRAEVWTLRATVDLDFTLRSSGEVKMRTSSNVDRRGVQYKDTDLSLQWNRYLSYSRGGSVRVDQQAVEEATLAKAFDCLEADIVGGEESASSTASRAHYALVEILSNGSLVAVAKGASVSTGDTVRICKMVEGANGGAFIGEGTAVVSGDVLTITPSDRSVGQMITADNVRLFFVEVR